MPTVDTGYKPHPWQLMVHQQMRRFSVLVCHRRFGKTVLAINSLLNSALKCKHDNGRYGYIAPYYNQAKSVAWDLLKQYGMRIPGAVPNESELTLNLPNGAKIRLFGANNADSLRGLFFDGIVMDEVADMAPNVWTEVVRPTLADRKGWCLFIGTPKGINLFYDLYHKALHLDTWYGQMFTSADTDLPWLDAEELKIARESMSDNAYRQEFLCDFNASTENTLITIDMVNHAVKKFITPGDYNRMPRVMGLDVARFGDDRSSLCMRQGLCAHPPRTWKQINNMDLAGIVSQQIHDWNPKAVFVDAGRGEGVIDRLRQLGHRNIIEVQFGGKAVDNQRYRNRRAEMWDGVRKWLLDGGVLPDVPDLKADLVAPQYSMPQDRMLLESKKDMKKRIGFSPDIGDSLALTFANPVRSDYSTVVKTVRSRIQQYDPLNYR